VNRGRVLDFTEIIKRDLQGRLDFVVQRADMEVAAGSSAWELRKRWRGLGRFHPDNSQVFPNVVMLNVRVLSGRARTLPGAMTIECPAVVRALQSIINDLPEAQPHSAVRAGILQEPYFAGGCSK
jgi:hypothetical protein